MELVGKLLGNRYEVLEKIGAGGMATVYEAKCKLLNRKVAIKVLKDEFSNDAEFIKRFQVEAQSAASLSHPNIVSIYDVGNEEGLHYIVMELIKGKTLKEVINEKGKLSWEEATNFASQIAAGLEQAHKNHIVHRDIKPHNIIITKDGVAKVTDFGIAKAVSNSTINAYGTTVGSVHYFSPEHARGGYTDEKSDIYSLGVVLYEMVTGKLPFDGETPVTVALKHLQEEPKEPISLVPTIPVALNDIILKAMRKEVSGRYDSAAQMNIDLKNVLKSPNTSGVSKGNKRDYPTQKVPIVGADRVEQIELSSNSLKNRNGGEKEMSKKKSLTKQQAITRLIVYVLLAIGIMFGTALLTTAALNILGEGQPVKVPTIIGYHKETAEEMLNKIGLEMEIEAVLESTEYAKDYIMYQEYEGRELKPGATVRVRVSKGAKTVLVPKVTDMSIEAAKMKIEENNLKFETEYEVSETVPAGEISRQEPKFNSEVAEGSVVTVYISKGIEDGMTLVPDVMDRTEAEARQILDAANLLVRVEYVKKDGAKDGVVVSQLIDANTSVSELTEVVIMINDLDGNTENAPGTNPETQNPTKPTNRTIPIDISKKGVRDIFTVRVELQGSSIGKQILYEGVHSREDKVVNVPVDKNLSGMLRVYIDDKLDSEMLIEKQ